MTISVLHIRIHWTMRKCDILKKIGMHLTKLYNCSMPTNLWFFFFTLNVRWSGYFEVSVIFRLTYWSTTQLDDSLRSSAATNCGFLHQRLTYYVDQLVEIKYESTAIHIEAYSLRRMLHNKFNLIMDWKALNEA